MRWLAPLAIAGLCTVPLHADVTITQTITTQGGGTAANGPMESHMVTRIKGMKNRTDMEFPGMSSSSLTDLTNKQVYVLRHDAKTANAVTPAVAPAASSADDITLKPTGQSKTILNVPCDEYTFATSMSLSEMISTKQMPPEAAAMLEDARVVIAGSMWVGKTGPAAADYLAFQKGAAAAGMMAGLAGVAVDSAKGPTRKMIAAIASAPGIPYVFEITFTVEGTGPMVEQIKSMGATKVTCAISAVSTDAIADNVFQVPDDYKIVK